ncbi:MAG: hypothetical protein AUJ32_01990 [Parcubacteria group bacterium CG1_02_40_82]|uniref:Uncharacterized protein n=4 Tax=Candidatus Portnoyibacteriota TaxID=1817913 RepID=A0A2M7IIG7_9BACT|nr:MAG: hypothetical protein AUJ32_01990 [Parcubacteria group bacterium CG1_02_40_82]PIQ75034.1 MAG: hypothetical protein COV84_03385 [Candidatus Portnoybacteria bacterium CG11_big_fil_rev_8_21_14_0_20_40_15]PIS30158.1 MAG: hypothetical protein COT41_03725 [Candidatus Portnoybacteria bacterium CG08_land_8_20_14_0_20_40_83]PIW76269.1 MAG: hypothetical protein CO001_02230 [Candidatus Portnoybacteria bacterium CG_4_8_14_3_um_filter_40_10]PIY74616.1 MAG: hypothetical protein COY85_02720 [Candidatus
MDQKKLEQVIKEYILRMIEVHKTHKGSTTDFLMDCPHCETARGMEFKEGAWTCLWTNCRYVLPVEVAPPGPEEFKQIMILKKRLNFLKRWNHLLN